MEVTVESEEKREKYGSEGLLAVGAGSVRHKCKIEYF